MTTGQPVSWAPSVIQSHYRFLTAELVNHLHDGGVAVWSWPTTEEQSIVDSIKVGADAVMGDDVRAMVRVVGPPRATAE